MARNVHSEEIDESIPWGFFNGAIQWTTSSCGIVGCLYLSNSHYFLLKSGLGEGTNNFVDLLALKMLLLFVVQKGCRNLQVFSDSMLIINKVSRSNDVT